MTPVPDQDALRAVTDVEGCALGEPIHLYAAWHCHDCGRCASLLVAAIAAQVERETRERDAKVSEWCWYASDMAYKIRHLDPRYGGNPTETEKGVSSPSPNAQG